ncbi:MAG: T9SS type A sorting domain-containing protein [Flavobacteriales bacterium]|nr:T9SS type A sorting domain-containing protein [Flavobacteriales bacterium]
MRIARPLLAVICISGATLVAESQVVTYVLEPSNIAGSYAFNYADPADGWGVADLTDPANAVVDTLALVDDGTAADTLGCGPLVNGVDVAGKIALVYRGTCEFGEKALSAQNAGAVAVILITNNPDAVDNFTMLPASQGANVTIPVVMITQAAGASIRAELDAGTDIVAFIGNKTGYFPNDVGLAGKDVRMADHGAIPSWVATDASEFNVVPGAWIHNLGSSDQSNVTLNVKVEQGGSVLYDETSTSAAISVGDSAYFTTPMFSQSSYSGLYDMTHTAQLGGGGEEFPDDNAFHSNFLVDSLLSYVPIDPMSEMPLATAFYQPSGNTSGYQACIQFQDPNASRLAALGIYASTTKSAPDSITGELVEGIAYQWLDAFTGLSDANYPGNAWTLDPLTTGEYTYSSDLGGEMVYIPFDDPIVLEDDARYLFCLQTFSADVFVGFDTKYDYSTNIDDNDQPVSCTESDGSWYGVGFGTDLTCAVSVLFGDASTIGIEELQRTELTPYPNPAATEIHIPLKGLSGIAQLSVHDATGRSVMDRQVTLGGDMLVVPANSFDNGAYLFDLRMTDGRRSTFRVVVTR